MFWYWDRLVEDGGIILKWVLYICSVLVVITFLKFDYSIKVFTITRVLKSCRQLCAQGYRLRKMLLIYRLVRLTGLQADSVGRKDTKTGRQEGEEEEEEVEEEEEEEGGDK